MCAPTGALAAATRKASQKVKEGAVASRAKPGTLVREAVRERLFERDIMRQRNMRAVIVGLVLIAGSIGFFLWMMTLRAQSTDPVALMRIVGQTSGVVFGLGLVVFLLGYFGVGMKKKSPG